MSTDPRSFRRRILQTLCETVGRLVRSNGTMSKSDEHAFC